MENKIFVISTLNNMYFGAYKVRAQASGYAKLKIVMSLF